LAHFFLNVDFRRVWQSSCRAVCGPLRYQTVRLHQR